MFNKYTKCKHNKKAPPSPHDLYRGLFTCFGRRKGFHSFLQGRAQCLVVMR